MFMTGVLCTVCGARVYLRLFRETEFPLSCSGIDLKQYLLWLHTQVSLTNNASIGFDNKIMNLI